VIRIALAAIAAFLAAPALADTPAQLPTKCAAEFPVDAPCTKLAGKYKIALAPREKSCVVTKKAAGILTVRGEGKAPKFDAGPLLEALGLKPSKKDKPELGAAIRDGVCCLDLRLYATKGAREQRVIVHMAAGANVVSAQADDRWSEARDECDEHVDVKVTRVP
jgi:hypothetical protein